MTSFEELEHTADWAFRARGRDVPELFVHAAEAMFALEQQQTIDANGQTRTVEVEGFDRETLLVNWLNELLYLRETTGEAYTGFEIEDLTDTHLRARLRVGKSMEHRGHIKAATFHNLKLQQTGEGWEATIVVDV